MAVSAPATRAALVSMPIVNNRRPPPPDPMTIWDLLSELAAGLFLPAQEEEEEGVVVVVAAAEQELAAVAGRHQSPRPPQCLATGPPQLLRRGGLLPSTRLGAGYPRLDRLPPDVPSPRCRSCRPRELLYDSRRARGISAPPYPPPVLRGGGGGTAKLAWVPENMPVS